MQIIPSSDTAKFEIVLRSEKLESEFNKRVAYIINGRYKFEFEVVASIEPVWLHVSEKSFNFNFKEDNSTLETVEMVKLTNHGNATAHFKWQMSE